MIALLIGLVVFLGVHLVPTRPALRGGLQDRLGQGGYKGLFSIVAAIGLVLIIWGKAEAPFIAIWNPPVWTRHVPLALMPIALILLVAAYVPNNLRRVVKHPMLAAVKLWALVHLLANGDLASMLLFAAFLAFAVVDVISAKKRATAPVRPRVNPMLDVLTVIIGLVAYMGLMHAHGHLFGVPVIA
ncbi:NnrU family protein [Abyssibacter sp.]|uniref:NnrU family protein n=1 Tax=Abyssibacter sp. TaxID=2320200 RepID=UPI000C6AB492|nr:NnrU family protein [Abyssibacter sp.]MBB87771.1 NnrU family protein [Xanthomonadales bacterium]MCK5858140.1 NnrU family protein [Abyssibacter sp.]